MGLPIWLYPFLLFILQMQFAYCSATKAFSYSPTPPSPPHSHDHVIMCPYEQSLALLQFKQNFIIDSSASSLCDDNGQPSQPKTMSWNRTMDCCKWEGVTCDGLTGHVIGLDLSCSQLQGTIHSNSTLFQLSRLKSLNLAYNDFSSSRISHQFGRFASLTRLNLSGSEFYGNVSSEILHLSNLVLLDLSAQDINLERNNFEMLLQNLTHLRQLSLGSIHISSALFPVNLSSSLTFLDLSFTGLSGKLPDELLHLPNLQVLKLTGNPDLIIPSYLSKAANGSHRSSLKFLDISYCNFFGTLPEWLGYLTQITYLSLAANSFSGALIPDIFAKLRHLSHLYLEFNNFIGPVPSSIGSLTQLVELNLAYNSLTGVIPSSIGNLTQLVQLDLAYNSLTGTIPSSIGNLTQLVELNLAFNSLTGAIPSSIGNLVQLVNLVLFTNSLTGVIPSSIGNLNQLVQLDLSSNSLTGTIPSSIGNLTGTVPSWLFSHPSLDSLDLKSNQSSGPIEEFQKHSTLKYFYLSFNQLHGSIPHSITKLKALQELDFSRNNLTGILELSMFSNHPNLELLDLSHNSLSVRTTNIDINATLPKLWALRLASCKVKEFPDLLWSMRNIGFLDLQQNMLQGPLPLNICNLSSLEVLDLSQNTLGGEILKCLGNFSSQLVVLNLKANNFHGTIPKTFVKGNNLRNLNFNGNQLEGKLPRSLANCKQLEILDLGNNHLNDTFPAWLGTFPELQVLVLKSNRFHGSIPNISRTRSPFNKLRIIDLSNNEFSGFLPSKYFRYFKAMVKVEANQTMAPEYMGGINHYEDSVTVTIKGMERELERILTVFTFIDMSNNKFEGEIPKYIGNLKSLRGLILSHNKLTGRIPQSLGNLSVLESLDLSFNQLEGKIPQLLTSLESLAFLNLSQNHLVGRIPQGKQFNTFDNSSYSGNSALCGFPLSKDCEGDKSLDQCPPPKLQEDDDSDFKSGFTWKVVCLGYGSGTIFGLVMGYLMFLTGKPKRLTVLVEKYQYKNGVRRGRQRRTRTMN